jgi:hypothetical protein
MSIFCESLKITDLNNQKCSTTMRRLALKSPYFKFNRTEQCFNLKITVGVSFKILLKF